MPMYIVQIATLLMVVSNLAIAMLATIRQWHPNGVIALAVVALGISILLMEGSSSTDRFTAMAFGLTYGTALTLACVSIGQRQRRRREPAQAPCDEPQGATS